MRTTVRIDDALYRRLKSRAAAAGRTVGEEIEDAVRAAIARSERREEDPGPLPVFGGSGVLPGVELMSNAALREHMDEGSGVDAQR